MFNKCGQFSPTVTISMGQGNPMIITYHIYINEVNEEENDRGKVIKNQTLRDIGMISMYVAPKIDEDNN